MNERGETKRRRAAVDDRTIVIQLNKRFPARSRTYAKEKKGLFVGSIEAVYLFLNI